VLGKMDADGNRRVLGYGDPESVEITSEDHSSRGHEPNHYAMLRWVKVDALITQLRCKPRGMTHVQVFATFYGNAGNRWNELEQIGRDPTASAIDRAFRGHGRIASLYGMTSSGERLLEWAEELRAGRGQPPSALSVQERMEQEVQSTSKEGAQRFSDNNKKVASGAHKGITPADEALARGALITRAGKQAEAMLLAACEAWREVLREAGEREERVAELARDAGRRGR
jgi:hypothetical protein